MCLKREVTERGTVGALRSISQMAQDHRSSSAMTRAKVITKGMAFAPAHGDTAFTVPMFDAFMKRVIPQFTPRSTRVRKGKN